MNHIFLEREFEPGLTAADVWNMVGEVGHCFQLYGVDWMSSALAAGGRRMLCHFRSPDSESVRTALRQSKSQMGPVWPGTVHEAPGMEGADPGHSNVVVTRLWSESVQLADIQAIEDAAAWCLEAHGVQFVRTFFSADRKRMDCFYRAADAESVRLAQLGAGMPVNRIWAFETLQLPK
jgi:hypothetical protein